MPPQSYAARVPISIKGLKAKACVGYHRQAMARKHFVVSLCLAGAASLLAWYFSRDSTQPAAPRRVIWIAIDSLRADHLGYSGYGRDTSPWLDQLAKKSVSFDWAISPANLTVLSVGSYLLGKPYSVDTERDFDAQHLTRSETRRIPEDEVTLPEALAAAGVRSLSYSAHPWVPRDRGFGQGFESVHLVGTPGKFLSDIDEMIRAIAQTYVQSAGREFIYVHTMDVHHPYRTPYPYGNTFAPSYSGDVVREGDIRFGERAGVHLRSIHPFWNQLVDVSDDDIAMLRGLYDGAIRYTDDKLPELLDALHWDPARDILIVSADHGEQLFEMGWWGHFATLSPMECHVPLLINSAHFAPRRVHAVVSLMDLYPTILDLFGVNAKPSVYAKSLRPTLEGGVAPSGTAYTESQPWSALSAAWISGDYWYWMRGSRWKLEPWHLWPYQESMYRFREDPLFEHDLIGDRPQEADEMNRALRAYHPRWTHFTRERMRGSDAGVALGENLLKPVGDPPQASGIGFVDGAWVLDTTQAHLVYRAEGLVAKEPVLFEMRYQLDSGRIRIRAPMLRRDVLSAVETLEQDGWEYICARPTTGMVAVSAPVVPVGDSVEFVIDVVPGTKALIQPPTLRSMTYDRILPTSAEEWADSPPDGLDLSPAERERLRALGYL